MLRPEQAAREFLERSGCGCAARDRDAATHGDQRPKLRPVCLATRSPLPAAHWALALDTGVGAEGRLVTRSVSSDQPPPGRTGLVTRTNQQNPKSKKGGAACCALRAAAARVPDRETPHRGACTRHQLVQIIPI
jgi:hypothetical protein